MRPGFARNYLLPQGFAIFATPHNLRVVDKHRERMRQIEEAKKADLLKRQLVVIHPRSFQRRSRRTLTSCRRARACPVQAPPALDSRPGFQPSRDESQPQRSSADACESSRWRTVTPDTFVVAKRGPAVTWRDIAQKDRMTVLLESGTSEVCVPDELQSVSSLSDDQALQIARLATSLEEGAGHPVDIEFAIAEGTLYLLQCRPITTLG